MITIQIAGDAEGMAEVKKKLLDDAEMNAAIKEVVYDSNGNAKRITLQYDTVNEHGENQEV